MDEGSGPTLFALMVFEQLHAFEGGSTTDELMRKFGLVVVVSVDLLVSVFRFS